ncbi:putative toxin-antitoxin system toxin component, PIN family [Marinoscillum furvescens]|uniref:Putative PIN family toxin of toxin-antitoxin system n=1 Tax=Marinoscillum furvescens DSM 4134 TaxID=1122208 RepID=A0A3D9L3U1_MARFU|nr:putative toxin-antitoxin system toxin component, PIN family [Marinoscillum furvescens]RED99860.1 putative PIN family toxin of toxin-antitoxin system [Marinoscillum furvescens DSM 4134]
MKVVLDTNIVFSAILNSNGLIGELLFNSEEQFEFYSSEYIIDELTKYKSKLRSLTKMSEEKIDVSIYQVLKNIDLISMVAISEIHWKRAYELAFDVDEDDTPFVATAIGLEASIWTGDKKLINGLRTKGFRDIYTTAELYELRA